MHTSRSPHTLTCAPVSPLRAGDLLTALLLAWTERHPGDLATAVEKALGALQGVLRVTSAAVAEEERRAAAEAAAAGGGGGAAVAGGDASLLSSREGAASVFRAKELRLVQAQEELVAPRVELRAEPLAQ